MSRARFAGVVIAALVVLLATATALSAGSRQIVSRTTPGADSKEDQRVAAAADLTPLELLGRYLFFDTNLSSPTGQACAACHGPSFGYTGPVSEVNAHGAVYPGAVADRAGNRKPPAAAYAGMSPPLYYDADEGVWLGGMFWDGRATGWVLGDPLAEQAMGPFLNPVEQNLPGPEAVCQTVRKSRYAGLFRQVWGKKSLDCGAGVGTMYEKVARSIAAFERSQEVSPYASKFDRVMAGEAEFTPMEQAGWELFNGEAQCAACHPAPLFTDFTYDNLGVPRNEENPFYAMPAWINPDGASFTDTGLGGFLMNAGYGAAVYEPEWGKQKVPTLRNVARAPRPDRVKAYSHNGYFKSLAEIVHFYNTRDVLPICMPGMQVGVDCWPAPEVGINVNVDELGNLGLTLLQEEALVTFMGTLSDGWHPDHPGQGNPPTPPVPPTPEEPIIE